MKTFPAICAAVLVVAAAIALKMDAGQPKQRGNGSRKTVTNRKTEVPPTTAERSDRATSLEESEKVMHPDNAKTPAAGDPWFSQHCGPTLTAIRNESDPERRDQMLTDLATKMEERDGTAALTFLTELEPSELIQDLQERLLQLWAEKDAPSAASAALKIGGRNTRKALETVMGVWADERLTDAIAWVKQMPEGTEKQAALLSIALEAARTEPQTAVSLASDLPSSPERDEMILHTASQWAATDPESASNWAHQVEDSSLRDQLLTTIATALGESNPAAAATLAIEELAQGKARDDALVGIVQRWVQNDPTAAAAWVHEFPEGALREAAVENIVKLWFGKDARPAGEWLNSLPPSPSRNSGIRAYAEMIAPSSPRQAADWAGTITDPQMRTAQLESIAKIWLASDPAAATTWLTQAPFSPEARNRILRR